MCLLAPYVLMAADPGCPRYPAALRTETIESLKRCDVRDLLIGKTQKLKVEESGKRCQTRDLASFKDLRGPRLQRREAVILCAADQAMPGEGKGSPEPFKAGRCWVFEGLDPRASLGVHQMDEARGGDSSGLAEQLNDRGLIPRQCHYVSEVSLLGWRWAGESAQRIAGPAG